MDTIRKFGCLFGLALGVAATGVQAQDYYDPGNRDPYYGNDGRNGYDGRDGYDDRYGRRTVRCESNDRRTNYCNVDTRGGVRLVNQLSDRRCIRGSTWGADSRGIWVSDGCRANFELAGSNGAAYGRVFRCESTDSRTRYCNVDTRGGVSIVRQLSRSSCIEGRTWGITDNAVWVSRGCRAEFSTGDRYSGNYDYRY